MTASSLVVGARGMTGGIVAAGLRDAGVSVVGTSRTPDERTVAARTIADLAAILAGEQFAQVVFTPQLASPGASDLLRLVDGPRWLVFSSAQLGSKVAAPGSAESLRVEAAALEAGATVLRPTMLFGHGLDRNVSSMIRAVRRLRTAPVVAGTTLVQPLHLDDVLRLVIDHGSRQVSGLFDVGGDEAVPVSELVQMIKEIIGTRLPSIPVPSSAVELGARFARLIGRRPDQLRRLLEDKTVDDAPVRSTFGWCAQPLAIRVEQAVAECPR